jgi:hypothetical protein
MSYPPDPAGVFVTDAHRRVMANAPNPDEDGLDVDQLVALRIDKDDNLHIVDEAQESDHDARVSYLTEDELCDVLQDLEADGHVKQLQDGWKNTPAGWLALTNQKWAA